MAAYFLLHVGVQDRRLGNLPIFSQCFAKASKVKNLVPKCKETTGTVQE
jgi:hypothetical protein